MDEPTQPIRPVQAAERSATSDKRRIVFIDIARGIGAILVFYSHITELWMRPRDENTLLVTAIDRMLRDPLHMQLQGIGQVAVPMFFMISGFVVTPLALRQGPFRFLVNRLLRIYPPLIPIARVVRLDDDGAVAIPLADPGSASFALVEAPYEPAASVDESQVANPAGAR